MAAVLACSLSQITRRAHSYPAYILRHVCMAGISAGGHSGAAGPRPVFKFVWRVCRLSFVFGCPRAPPSVFQRVSGTGTPYTARPIRGDSTASGQRSRFAFPPLRGWFASRQAEEASSPLPPLTFGRRPQREPLLEVFFAYVR